MLKKCASNSRRGKPCGCASEKPPIIWSRSSPFKQALLNLTLKHSSSLAPAIRLVISLRLCNKCLRGWLTNWSNDTSKRCLKSQNQSWGTQAKLQLRKLYTTKWCQIHARYALSCSYLLRTTLSSCSLADTLSARLVLIHTPKSRRLARFVGKDLTLLPQISVFRTLSWLLTKRMRITSSSYKRQGIKW